MSLFPFLPDPARLAVRALNTLLAREDWARERLGRHAGKTVRFTLGGFDLRLKVAPDGTAEPVDASEAGRADPDVTLTVVPERVTLERLLPGAAGPDAYAEMSHIAGDASFAQVVADLARQLRWDPEDALARRVGDIPAARLAGAARALRTGLRTAGERLAGNVAEYLSEESAALAGRPLFAQFEADRGGVDGRLEMLAERAARIDARLRRLSSPRSA